MVEDSRVGDGKGARREQVALHAHLHSTAWQIPVAGFVVTIVTFVAAFDLIGQPVLALGLLLVGAILSTGMCCTLVGVRLRASALPRPQSLESAPHDTISPWSGFLMHLALALSATLIFAALVGWLAALVFTGTHDTGVGVAVGVTLFVIGAAGDVLFLLGVEKRIRGS